jgi:hypothetical protein
MKTLLTSFGHNISWYPKGQERLKKSFLINGYDGDMKFYQDESELGCPLHSDTPYAFKAYALEKALDDGYERVIWADASITLNKPFSALSERLDKFGYVLCQNGWNSGQWCSDAALEPLGITREESFGIPHIMACAMAFDLKHVECINWLSQYCHHADIDTFKGAWSNGNNEVSQDPRVLGHRHDQTVGSVVAWKLGMRDWLQKGVFYDEGQDTTHKPEFMFCLRHGI